MNRSRPKTTIALETKADAESFIGAWRWWLLPAALTLTLSVAFVDPFIGDWDGLDYTVLALHGQPSSMVLGRMLFIFTNHALYRFAHVLFNLPPEKAYLLFKYAVVAQSPLAIVACWALARDVTHSVQAATVAVLFIALSPIFILYSGQAMTDVPALLLLAVALTVHLRGVRSRRLWVMLAGAALLGAGVNVRETTAFYAPWLAVAPFVCGWKPRRREIGYIALTLLVFLVFAFGGFAYWFATDPAYRAAWYGWRESMREESARHPIALRNALPFITYFFFMSPLVPVALPVAAYKEWRAYGWSLKLALAGIGLWATLLLFFHYSVTINWRYFLTGLPALAPLVADYFIRSQTARWGSVRLAFTSAVAGVALVAVAFGYYMRPLDRHYQEARALAKDYRAQLTLVPRDAVMISGGQTVAVTYWRGVGAGMWDVIGTGGGWPGARLGSVIERYLKESRRVFLDMDPRWWTPCGWQRQEIYELSDIEPRFHFRRISETIYEIRPLDDESAHDAPHLQSLLPESRSDEVKRCTALG